MSRISPRTLRSRAAGIDLLVCPTEVKEVVCLRGALPGGGAHAPGNPAVPLFAAQLLDQGTLRRDKLVLARRLEEVGASLGFNSGSQMVGIHGRCLREDVPLLIELLAEQLREPAYAAGELERAKVATIGALQRRKDEGEAVAAEAFGLSLYPPGHPNRPVAVDEMIAAIHAVSPDELHAFWRRSYGTDQMKLLFVGDVDAGAIVPEVEKRFADWPGGLSPIGDGPSENAGTGPKQRTIFLPQKSTVHVVLGQLSGVSRKSPDHLPLQLATQVLGTGFTSRLMRHVRVQEGLTYGIGAGLNNDLFMAGDWRISTSFTPGLLEQGLASIQRQLEIWHRAGVTEAELALRQSSLTGGFLVGLSTTAGLADQIMQTVQAGFDVAWLDDFPARVAALALDQVNAAVQAHLDPGRMTTIKVGSVAEG